MEYSKGALFSCTGQSALSVSFASGAIPPEKHKPSEKMKTEKIISIEFSASEILARAYRQGWNHGHGIACHNVPELGATIRTDSLGRVTVDADNIREVHESLCYEAESNSRDFSPFEFVAHELNELGEGSEDSPSADEAWEAFGQGIADSIASDLSTYSDEDYGIGA